MPIQTCRNNPRKVPRNECQAVSTQTCSVRPNMDCQVITMTLIIINPVLTLFFFLRMSTRPSATSFPTSSAGRRPSSSVRRSPSGSVARSLSRAVMPPASPATEAARPPCQVMAEENNLVNLFLTKSCNCYFSCYLLYLFDSSTLLLLVILSFK